MGNKVFTVHDILLAIGESCYEMRIHPYEAAKLLKIIARKLNIDDVDIENSCKEIIKNKEGLENVQRDTE